MREPALTRSFRALLKRIASRPPSVEDADSQSQEEAEERARRACNAGSATACADDALPHLIDMMFRHYLGRPPSAGELDSYLLSVSSGRPLPAIIEDIQSSQEAKTRQTLLDSDTAFKVNLLYRHYLGRDADEHGLRIHVDALKAGTLFSTLARGFESSEEATRARQSGSNALSDGEFIVAMADILFDGRGVLAEEVEHWQRFLQSDRSKRLELLKGAIEARYQKLRTSAEVRPDTDRCWIMGTTEHMSPQDWAKRKAATVLRGPASPPRSDQASNARGAFRHSGTYLVSAIASMYRAGEFIERFLENIVSQTIFDRSELIIIDADSPDNESRVIAEFQERYPNIVYKRINYRIGIYDAWNVGVGMARGAYLTSTNMDDLRSPSSFEMQADVLGKYPFVDVVYQDFYYSLDGTMSFDEVAAVNVKSDLPHVTPHGLLRYNAPHNAPMWRKALHSDLGLFDTSFRSAGDWEFWLRCVSEGKTFFKINTPHVVYFQNPNGLSTRPNTRGLEEGLRVLQLYSGKLISPELRATPDALAARLGLQPDSHGSHYGLAQQALDRLGLSFRASARVQP